MSKNPEISRALRCWLAAATAAALLGASSAAADDDGAVRVSLPAPGPCASPRGSESATSPDVFEVSGSPADKLTASQVAAAGLPGGLEPPPPAPMRMPTRSPCDGVGGPCVVANTAPPMGPSGGSGFVEPPPVNNPPPGVPGGPPGVP
jgi:hypothetical protein